MEIFDSNYFSTLRNTNSFKYHENHPAYHVSEEFSGSALNYCDSQWRMKFYLTYSWFYFLEDLAKYFID